MGVPKHTVTYVIHKAASNYYWDNVAFYDFTFRQLMARKPWRSWSKTYNQAWNLAMSDLISKNNSSGKNFQGSGGSQQQKQDWRDDCCWRYNKNRCNKTVNDCKFDHRCTYCGGWNHRYFNCRKSCPSRMLVVVVTVMVKCHTTNHLQLLSICHLVFQLHPVQRNKRCRRC